MEDSNHDKENTEDDARVPKHGCDFGARHARPKIGGDRDGDTDNRHEDPKGRAYENGGKPDRYNIENKERYLVTGEIIEISDDQDADKAKESGDMTMLTFGDLHSAMASGHINGFG